jgi:hypothetical protein
MCLESDHSRTTSVSGSISGVSFMVTGGMVVSRMCPSKVHGWLTIHCQPWTLTLVYEYQHGHF